MLLGVTLLFLAIAVITPVIFFTLVKFVGKYFSLVVDKGSFLRDKFSR